MFSFSYTIPKERKMGTILRTIILSFADVTGLGLAIFTMLYHTLGDYKGAIIFIVSLVYMVLRVYYFVQAIAKRAIENRMKRMEARKQQLDLFIKEQEVKNRLTKKQPNQKNK